MNNVSYKVRAAYFSARYHATGEKRSAIFGGRKALMDEIWETGNPIFVDESYFVTMTEYGSLVKNGDTYSQGYIKDMANWRECHYYTEYVDAEGNKAWLLTGGRYD